MSTSVWTDESPDPRFEILGTEDNEGSLFHVYFSEKIDDKENPLYDTKMPDGEAREYFESLSEALRYVRDMAKCLDTGKKLKKFPAWVVDANEPAPRLRVESGWLVFVPDPIEA